MKIRLAVAAMALVSLAGMQAAHAQDSGCPLLQNIVDGASAGFPDQRGEEIDDDWFDSRLYLTGADDCSINAGAENLFYCAWGFDNPAAANSLATALVGAATECFPGWAVLDTAGAKSPNNLVILKGVTLSGAGSYAGTRVLVFAESFSGSQESQVTIEVRR